MGKAKPTKKPAKKPTKKRGKRKKVAITVGFFTVVSRTTRPGAGEMIPRTSTVEVDVRTSPGMAGFSYELAVLTAAGMPLAGLTDPMGLSVTNPIPVAFPGTTSRTVRFRLPGTVMMNDKLYLDFGLVPNSATGQEGDEEIRHRIRVVAGA